MSSYNDPHSVSYNISAINSYEGKVIEIDKDEYTMKIVTHTGYKLAHCFIPKDGGYGMPEVGDNVIVEKVGETQKLIYRGKAPMPNFSTKKKIENKDDKESRDLSGHELVDMELGSDLGASSKERRRDINPGDHVVFDSNGSYCKAHQTGDLSFIISDILQAHFIKKWDKFKLFFRRLVTRWPGGHIQIGDFKPNDEEDKKESIRAEFYSDTNTKELNKIILEHGYDAVKYNLSNSRISLYRNYFDDNKQELAKVYYEEGDNGDFYVKHQDIKNSQNVEVLVKDGIGKVELSRGGGSVKIEISISGGQLTIQTTGPISIKSSGPTTIDGQSGVTVIGHGNLQLR